MRVTAFLVAAAATIAISGCSNGKQYDISPIFPLSADTCAKYNGDEPGDGSCLVTESDCERAAEDWRLATRNVSGAIQFSCD
jgi:hypothetical protein